MGRIIVANRRGHQALEWAIADTDEARQQIAEAERMLREVARLTRGDDLWQQLQRAGHLDVASRMQPGLRYRLRVGRRNEVICALGVRSPWRYNFLCIKPTYPMPEEEFFAHLYLYLYVRDCEETCAASPRPSPGIKPSAASSSTRLHCRRALLFYLVGVGMKVVPVKGAGLSTNTRPCPPAPATARRKVCGDSEEGEATAMMHGSEVAAAGAKWMCQVLFGCGELRHRSVLSAEMT